MTEKTTAQPAPLNIFQRIHAVMGEVDYVQKEKKDGMKYTVVSHDRVTALVRPILHKHGVVYYPRDMARTQDGNRTQIDFTVRFQNIDDKADFMDVETCGYGVDQSDKGVGKAISYGVKYALLKALGLETGDDPDTDDAGDHQTAPTREEMANWVDGYVAWIDQQTEIAAIHASWTKTADRRLSLPGELQDRLQAARAEALARLAPVGDKSDPREAWTNDSIAWIREQTNMAPIADWWKKESKAIAALPADQRAALTKAKDDAKRRLSGVSTAADLSNEQPPF